ncbi:MAG: alpha-E domain-containing protein [Phycisphaerales bacterium]|nr:alpha-E domain-containing protein [Phycisphaerales bacterium]
MSIVLARAAENGYWFGRYLERASDFVRLLASTDTVATEVQGFSPAMSVRVWSEMEQVFTAIPSPEEERTSVSECQRFLLDTAEPMSVASSIRNARENARAFRETLALESFTLLNATWQLVREIGSRVRDSCEKNGTPPPIMIRTALEEMQQAIFAVCGAIDRTAGRGDAWRFMHMGTLLERALRTAEVLRVIIPAIRLEDEAAPARYARMRAVLRALASLECYHHEFGARLNPTRISTFLMFHPEPPHALLPCIEAIDRDLTMMARRGRVEEPTRRAGLLVARLRFEGGGGEILEPDRLAQEISGELGSLHKAITDRFFTV